jgi:hypothetical protein
MLEVRSGPDPYVFYKMHHVDRARAAWALSEDLGLYEALRDGPRTVPEVASRLGLTQRPVAALLSANGCLGITGNDDGRWFIHPIMREFVLEGGRARITPRPDREVFWYRVTKQAVLSGAPVPEEMPAWLSDPEGRKAETRAHVPQRNGWRLLWGEALAEAFDFSPYRLVLDIGGATGGVLAGLTGKCPWLRGVVMDLPYSQVDAEAALQECGAAGRVTFQAGSFFSDPYPEGVDILFMSHVIHDWNDEDCLRLLRHAHVNLPDGAPVLVQEFLLDDDKCGQLLGVYQWFGMLYGTTGDQRTAREIGRLLEQTGFSGIESRSVDGEQSLVVGWKR